MTVDPLAFASVFLNSFCLLCGGIACAFICMETVFERKHAPYLFFAFFAAKMGLIAVSDAMTWFDVRTEWLPTIGSASAVANAFAFFITYYCWKASLFKIGFAGFFADMVSALCMAPTLVAVNSVTGGEPLLSYIGEFGLDSLARPIIMVALFWMALRIAGPILRRLMAHEFKDERPLLFIFCLYLAYVVSTQVSNIDEAYNAVLTPTYQLVFFVLPVAVLLVAARQHIARMRMQHLIRVRDLVAECDDALREQAAFLEQSRDVLDNMAARIERLEAGGARDDLARYLDRLREVCERLRFGTYSDNPALDVVLVAYEERFREQGLQVSYTVSPLANAGEQPALAAQALLEWALLACTARKPRTRGGERATDAKGQAKSAPGVELRAFRRANRLLFEAKVGGSSFGWAWVLRKRLESHVPAGCSIVALERADERLVARMLVEERAL